MRTGNPINNNKSGRVESLRMSVWRWNKENDKKSEEEAIVSITAVWRAPIRFVWCVHVAQQSRDDVYRRCRRQCVRAREHKTHTHIEERERETQYSICGYHLLYTHSWNLDNTWRETDKYEELSLSLLRKKKKQKVFREILKINKKAIPLEVFGLKNSWK